MTSESVRQAAAMPDLNHRDPEFIEILRDTKRRLLNVYPETAEDWRCFLIGGSGTAAVEAMITSCVSEGPVLVIDSGYYSGRMRAKLEAHEIPYTALITPWLEPISLEHLEQVVAGHEAVLTTHHETTAGRLHPIDKIGEICRAAGAKLLVDAMSSFGGDPISYENVDAVASSANKCLHGLPGASFVLVRDWLADEMKAFPSRTVYLSLPMYAGDSPPLTAPVPILTALNQALREMGARGAAARHKVYSARAERVRDGLRNRGFRFAIPEESMSSTLTTASIPNGYDAESWLAANRKSGFVLYGTKSELRPEWFQVANMGEITLEHLDLWLAAVDDLTN
jgi:2-aminoethylphosphonate-pyruvate transaminase